MKRLVVLTPGGPENITIGDAPVPTPGPRDAVVAIAYSGINFIDVYYRIGLYKSETPIVLGSEGAGTVTAVGSDVRDVAVGDRVAYTMHRGSHAESVVVPAASLAPIPDGVDFATAAAAMLQGATAHYLTHSTFPLEAGHTCLVHAAAGGAGGLIVQFAKQRGARVIGTTSSEAKAREVSALGADHVINYVTDDFETEVKRLTGGRGVDVVYDSVGLTTFTKSLKVLRPRGLMALFGQSSGAVPPFDPNILNGLGSLFLTRPSLGHYLATREELLWRAGDVMNAILSGALNVRIAGTFPMEKAADAYHALEGRHTAGKLLLKVGA